MSPIFLTCPWLWAREFLDVNFLQRGWGSDGSISKVEYNRSDTDFRESVRIGGFQVRSRSLLSR